MYHLNQTLSIIVPVYNEAGNITKLDKEIQSVAAKLTNTFEVIYINDGSTDGTLAELKTLAHVTILSLSRNYGQATARDLQVWERKYSEDSTMKVVQSQAHPLTISRIQGSF